MSPSRKSTPAAPLRPPLDLQLGTLLVAALLVVPPFLISPFARESFRQPKLYASGWLALASLLALVWGLRRVHRVGWATLRGLPALSAALPFVAVATLGLAVTRHPIQVREGLFDLWIGAACLVGWSAALPGKRMEQLLAGLLLPASALALFGILQYHGLWRPFSFLGLAAGDRLAITSLAGNPGDLGAYLALPCLIAQRELARRTKAGALARDAGFWGFAAAFVLCLYGLALTQTLAAVAAVVLGSLLFWVVRVGALPRRRGVLLIGLIGLALALALGLALGIAPLRGRIAEKVYLIKAGAWNEVFSGRFDGWQTALWMAREHPLTGVGHGAYRPEFVAAKLALLDRGRAFSPHQAQVVFANAHSEPLEVAADLGLPGLAALAWGIWTLRGQLRRLGSERPADERALAWAGVAALAVLSLASFPFRVALVAFPALFFLSWVLRPLPMAVEEAR